MRVKHCLLVKRLAGCHCAQKAVTHRSWAESQAVGSVYNMISSGLMQGPEEVAKMNPEL